MTLFSDYLPEDLTNQFEFGPPIGFYQLLSDVTPCNMLDVLDGEESPLTFALQISQSKSVYQIVKLIYGDDFENLNKDLKKLPKTYHPMIWKSIVFDCAFTSALYLRMVCLKEYGARERECLMGIVSAMIALLADPHRPPLSLLSSFHMATYVLQFTRLSPQRDFAQQVLAETTSLEHELDLVLKPAWLASLARNRDYDRSLGLFMAVYLASYYLPEDVVEKVFGVTNQRLLIDTSQFVNIFKSDSDEQDIKLFLRDLDSYIPEDNHFKMVPVHAAGTMDDVVSFMDLIEGGTTSNVSINIVDMVKTVFGDILDLNLTLDSECNFPLYVNRILQDCSVERQREFLSHLINNPNFNFEEIIDDRVLKDCMRDFIILAAALIRYDLVNTNMDGSSLALPNLTNFAMLVALDNYSGISSVAACVGSIVEYLTPKIDSKYLPLLIEFWNALCLYGPFGLIGPKGNLRAVFDHDPALLKGFRSWLFKTIDGLFSFVTEDSNHDTYLSPDEVSMRIQSFVAFTHVDHSASAVKELIHTAARETQLYFIGPREMAMYSSPMVEFIEQHRSVASQID